MRTLQSTIVYPACDLMPAMASAMCAMTLTNPDTGSHCLHPTPAVRHVTSQQFVTWPASCVQASTRQLWPRSPQPLAKLWRGTGSRTGSALSPWPWPQGSQQQGIGWHQTWRAAPSQTGVNSCRRCAQFLDNAGWIKINWINLLNQLELHSY